MLMPVVAFVCTSVVLFLGGGSACLPACLCLLAVRPLCLPEQLRSLGGGGERVAAVSDSFASMLMCCTPACIIETCAWRSCTSCLCTRTLFGLWRRLQEDLVLAAA